MKPIDLLRVHLDQTGTDDEIISAAINRMSEDARALADLSHSLSDVTRERDNARGLRHGWRLQRRLRLPGER